VKIRPERGLLYVSADLGVGGRSCRFDRVLLDTGSAGSVFAADPLLEIDVTPRADDVLRRIRGVGGSEFVYTRTIDRLAVGELEVTDFFIEVGAMDYGFPLDGLLGVDFLRAVGAVIDLERLELRGAAPV